MNDSGRVESRESGVWSLEKPRPDARHQTPDTRLRSLNRNAALAMLLVALTFLFYPSEEGMAWMMWRDAPLLALTLLAGAAFCALRWRRLLRSAHT